MIPFPHNIGETVADNIELARLEGRDPNAEAERLAKLIAEHTLTCLEIQRREDAEVAAIMARIQQFRPGRM